MIHIELSTVTLIHKSLSSRPGSLPCSYVLSFRSRPRRSCKCDRRGFFGFRVCLIASGRETGPNSLSIGVAGRGVLNVAEPIPGCAPLTAGRRPSSCGLWGLAQVGRSGADVFDRVRLSWVSSCTRVGSRIFVPPLLGGIAMRRLRGVRTPTRMVSTSRFKSGRRRSASCGRSKSDRDRLWVRFQRLTTPTTSWSSRAMRGRRR